ncbi:hypothetical protein ALDI51_25280 [Alicycliphilus denitrificans]|uniref:hypothetical protein n=1 Tax=Alicycliphilus denitrificans TaxID=179636 RepID=UPI00191556D9|nr:hypothetical protein [Alicycliphilus denitrificans]MBN9576276.1 hypothetical protein [Alicycliphilus denitrificans]BCN39209.1 hypothetical protein ALDI51_25280 [Alicycliphilus denitrificans]
MTEILGFLNENSGALTVLFTAVVTIATAVYAALTWILVQETRMMREVQTEPKLQVTVNSFDFAIHIVRLHIRNVGLGPALNVAFKPKVLSGGASAERLLAEFTDVNFFGVGLKHFGPGQERVSAYTQLTEDHDGKIASVLALEVTYGSATGKQYSDVLVVDMSELKGSYQLGKPHAYAIAQSLEKMQKDIHHLSTGFHRIKANVYTSEDREEERAEAQARREQWQREHKAQQVAQADGPASGGSAS